MMLVASMLIPFQAVMPPLVGVLKNWGINNQLGLILVYNWFWFEYINFSLSWFY
jgi:ABC-type glycerol-3-phosphate transport system permease component